MSSTSSITDKEPDLDNLSATSDRRNITDVIPIWALIIIFLAVLSLIYYLMADTWLHEWKRYRSLQTQATANYAGSIPPLEWLVSKDSDNPTYLGELGHSYLNVKDYDNALKHLLEAQKHRANIPPDDHGNAREQADFNTNIGRAYFGKADYANAEKHLLEGLKFNKLDPFANYYMGEVEMTRNNYVKAADYFKVVARDPHFEELVKKHYQSIEQKLFAGIGADESTTGTAAK